jgi:GNAT superfamily N-acetyltransferase
MSSPAWAVETRWRALDPLLPAPWQPEPIDTVLRAGTSTGFARRVRIPPHDPVLLWGAADRFSLRPLPVGPDLAAGMDALLTAWQRWLAAQPDPPLPDSVASVNWPSRDTRALPALWRHGLAPYSVIAARRAGTAALRSPGGTGAGSGVRRATGQDMDAVAGLSLCLQRYETDFGSSYPRERAGEWIREDTARMLSADQPWVWVAEQAGTVVGLLEVQPPGLSTWIELFTRARPMAYLSTLYVDPSARGSGIGTALVDAAHRALDTAGVAVTLLHYAQTNPVSGPFWHRAGYRPLWTSWQARPAGTLR